MSVDESHPLRPTLDRAQETLRNALEVACAADVNNANTGELIRVEEMLAIANEAAKEAISVRRRLNEDSEAGHAAPSSHREIEDSRGVRWAVFAVHPSSIGSRPTVREGYRDGWLSFDSGMETRRVAPIPARWAVLADDELLALCEQAEVAPRRVRTPNIETQREITG